MKHLTYCFLAVDEHQQTWIAEDIKDVSNQTVTLIAEVWGHGSIDKKTQQTRAGTLFGGKTQNTQLQWVEQAKDEAGSVMDIYNGQFGS